MAKTYEPPGTGAASYTMVGTTPTMTIVHLPAWWVAAPLRIRVALVTGFGLFLWLLTTAPAPTLPPTSLVVATWNVGAINNNPFEYWLTMDDDPRYEDLMNKVEAFVQAPPPKKDVEASFIFTEDMFVTLMGEMRAMGWAETELQTAQARWRDDWSKRHVVSGLLKDPAMGSKRLISMPDRVTNTMTGQATTLYRPAATNCYPERFGTVAEWWTRWLRFMFHTPVRDGGKVPAALLERIPRAKYPALTEEEERASLPLQTLAMALFDAVQVRMLNQLVGAEAWQTLRARICQALNTRKIQNTLDLVQREYSSKVDVVFLQETSAALIDRARHELGRDFHVLAPAVLGRSDQNSIVLLRKAPGIFPSSEEELNYEQLRSVANFLPERLVSDGDLFALVVDDRWGRSFVLASFHGDTNGLATIPVVRAVSSAAPHDALLVMGLDANTYFRAKPETGGDGERVQVVGEFQSFLVSQHLASCWGAAVPPHTTRNARTFMQPQLSKAATREQIEAKGDVNPKDFVVFRAGQFALESQPALDNTGKRGRFDPDLVFPTLDFPSDHAVLSVELRLIRDIRRG